MTLLLELKHNIVVMHLSPGTNTLWQQNFFLGGGGSRYDCEVSEPWENVYATLRLVPRSILVALWVVYSKHWLLFWKPEVARKY